MTGIRFASINIEGHRHREAVVSFLRDFKPDVVCFQELFENDISFFEEALRMTCSFFPTMQWNPDVGNSESTSCPEGVGIFSSLPVSNVRKDFYYKSNANLPTFILGDETTLHRGLLRVTAKKENESYTIGVTHFTRTPDGSTSEKQREDLKNLLKLLADTPEIILCGDFNAPRGGEIFTNLSEVYRDNIPPYYTSSLDPKLHKLQNRKLLMVDGLFSTPGYKVTDAKLSEGVSDHVAVTACIDANPARSGTNGY